jgi:Carboxypeptidase regulatory-like domain
MHRTVLLIVSVVSVAGCGHLFVQRDAQFSVSGTVVSEAGRGIKDAEVTLALDGTAYRAVTPLTGDRAETDEAGRFAFTYLTHSKSLRYTLSISKPGFTKAEARGVSPPASVHTITLTPVKGASAVIQ